MRTRRRWAWLVFAAGAVLVLEALGWVTWRAVTLERRERVAREAARAGELTRLALWRMESEVSGLLAQEAGRPYFEYRSVSPAGRAYGRMWEEALPGEAVWPSPLLEPPGPVIRLHFEIGADGRVGSPQVPQGAAREVSVGRFIDREFVLLSETRLGEFVRMLGARGGVSVLARRDGGREFAGADEAGGAGAGDGDGAGRGDELARQEVMARQQAAQRVLEPRRSKVDGSAAAMPGVAAGVAEPIGVETTALEPRWLVGDGVEPELVVLRWVRVGEVEVTQGFWVDWSALSGRLEGAVSGLLPGARVRPGVDGSEAGASRRMASLPVVLEAGVLPRAVGEGGGTGVVLVLTWSAAVAAIGAIGVVVHRSMELSDRRGRFVAAVSHELRTPLTTVRLYADLLASEAARDEGVRAGYVSTLRSEAARLGRIVEDVLSFARLGREDGRRVRRGVGEGSGAIVGEVVASMRGGLERAAAEGGLRLVVEAMEEGARTARVGVDGAVVERIVTNLVENAARYASDGEPREVRLRVEAGAREVRVRVRDFGPGIGRGEEKRVFEAFWRGSAGERSGRAGLGLGLSIARGLARDAGGEVEVEREGDRGVTLVVRLPRA